MVAKKEEGEEAYAFIFLFFSQLLLILHFSCSTSSTTPSHHTSRLLQKRTHSFYLHTRDEGLASPALIYLEVAADEAGFHFIIAFDKIDDEYILYIAVAITILDIEKLNLYTHDKHRTSKCHHIGDTD